MPGVMMLSRDLKRVPLDFDWPLNKTWDGYLSPNYRPCPSEDCDNGMKLAAAWVEKLAHLILMLGDAPADSGQELHPWLAGLPLQPDQRPLANVREITGGLAGRPWRAPFGHDACDRWSATKAIIAAAGLPEDWGTCPVCHGHAMHPDDIEASDAWEPTQPPTGDGYQLWESVSEGSPVSPVFDNVQALAEWLSANDTSILRGKSVSDWLSILDGEVHGTDIQTGALV